MALFTIYLAESPTVLFQVEVLAMFGYPSAHLATPSQVFPACRSKTGPSTSHLKFCSDSVNGSINIAA